MSRPQARPKSLITSHTSSQSTTTTREHGRKTSHIPRPNVRINGNDATSDQVTSTLIRRTLCAHLGDKGRGTLAPINELLPPLTSSNEVDLQLYALISIIIREFVQTWYNKITPDQVFVEEVVKIIAHCTRALEQRLRNVDLESLVFDELPELLDVHFKAYRASRQSLHPPPFKHEPRAVYHSLWPFPALSPIPADEAQQKLQTENEAYYRQLLIQGALTVLLPTEDLENDCLTALVGQILSEMIIGGGIAGKACEPWLLWEAITKIAEVVQAQLPKSKVQTRLERSSSQPKSVDLPVIVGGKNRKWTTGINLEKTFWLVLQYGFLVFTTIRLVITTVANASSLPSRSSRTIKLTSSVYSDRSLDGSQPLNSTDNSKQPIIIMRLWSVVATCLDLEARMPWLSGILSMVQWMALRGPGEFGNTDGILDKMLSHAIHTHVLRSSHVPTLLRTIRGALFPSNTLAPPRIIPSAAEALLIRRKCAETLLSLVPVNVQHVYFGTGSGTFGQGSAEDGRERRIKEVEEVLNVFDDNYCNKHLMYGVVELILVRLIPELSARSIEDLRDERLG